MGLRDPPWGCVGGIGVLRGAGGSGGEGDGAPSCCCGVRRGGGSPPHRHPPQGRGWPRGVNREVAGNTGMHWDEDGGRGGLGGVGSQRAGVSVPSERIFVFPAFPHQMRLLCSALTFLLMPPTKNTL